MVSTSLARAERESLTLRTVMTALPQNVKGFKMSTELQVVSKTKAVEAERSRDR
jgi:hypothetical protein